MLRACAVMLLSTAVFGQEVNMKNGNVHLRPRQDGKVTIQKETTIDVFEYETRIAKLEDEFKNFATKEQAQVAAYDATLDATATVFAAVTDAQLKMKEFQDELSAELKESLNAFETEMSKFLQDSADELNNAIEAEHEELSNNITNVTDHYEALGSSLSDYVDKGFECTKNGLAFNSDTGSCIAPALIQLGQAKGACKIKGAITYEESSKSIRVCDGAKWVSSTNSKEIVPVISHRGFSNNDGRDGGYVNERYLIFNKAADDTYIKVTYYDNMRVHGNHWCAANWNVRICDQNGNDCQECSDPGLLNMNKYSHQQHNYWMNDHYAHTIHGICRKRANRQITAGRYRLRVYIHHQRCDIYTGHSGQYGSLQVQEVYKQ